MNRRPGQRHEDGQHEELEDHQKQVGVAAASIPMTLRIEVMMMKPTIHIQCGTPGNLVDRKAAPMSQMTNGPTSPADALRHAEGSIGG
jgi:hypothetical protein